MEITRHRWPGRRSAMQHAKRFSCAATTDLPTMSLGKVRMSLSCEICVAKDHLADERCRSLLATQPGSATGRRTIPRRTGTLRSTERVWARGSSCLRAPQHRSRCCGSRSGPHQGCRVTRSSTSTDASAPHLREGSRDQPRRRTRSCRGTDRERCRRCKPCEPRRKCDTRGWVERSCSSWDRNDVVH